jgi:2'-5' RNA ligase
MSIRAFFAVDLAPRARRAAAVAAAELSDGAAGVRWVREEAYHVTLRFLGQVDRAAAPGLAEAVAHAVSDQAPFSVRLGAVRLFPSLRRPRAVVLDLEPEGPLARLAAAVEAGVVGSGLPAQERPFRSHLTLGRIRGRERPVLPSVAESGVELPVAEVVLFESQLRREGARYIPLERIALGGSVSPDHPTRKGEEHGEE